MRTSCLVCLSAVQLERDRGGGIHCRILIIIGPCVVGSFNSLERLGMGRGKVAMGRGGG